MRVYIKGTSCLYPSTEIHPNTSSQWFLGFFIRHHNIKVLQIIFKKEQPSFLSVLNLQRIHWVSIVMPQLIIQSLVVNQPIKACLGIVLENHNNFRHLTTGNLVLTLFQAPMHENRLDFPAVNIGLFSLSVSTKLNLLWMHNRSSDLAGSQIQSPSRRIPLLQMNLLHDTLPDSHIEETKCHWGANPHAIGR